MSLAEEIHKWLTGSSASSQAPGIGEMLDDIERRTGSGRAAARYLGIGKSSWQRWKSGQTKTMVGAKLARVQTAWRGLIIRNDQADAWRHDQMVIHLRGERLGPGGKTPGSRVVSARNLRIAPGTGDAVVNLWLAGDAAGAAAAFVAGIQDTFYRRTMFGEWFDDPAATGGGEATKGYEVLVTAVN